MATVAAEPTQTVPSEVDVLVARALNALDGFADFDQEQVDYIVKKASVAALTQHGQLARLAVEETGRGVFEDKAVKNIFACEHVTHSMRGLKTVGVIARDEHQRHRRDRRAGRRGLPASPRSPTRPRPRSSRR